MGYKDRSPGPRMGLVNFIVGGIAGFVGASYIFGLNFDLGKIASQVTSGKALSQEAINLAWFAAIVLGSAILGMLLHIVQVVLGLAAGLLVIGVVIVGVALTINGAHAFFYGPGGPANNLGNVTLGIVGLIIVIVAGVFFFRGSHSPSGSSASYGDYQPNSRYEAQPTEW